MVSVIIPCYNDGHFLHDAVNSVLDSSYNNIEIIIINDGSTDLNTLKVLEQLEQKGIKILHQSNKGLGFSRNRGIQEAKGKYILPLDADNKVTADYIKKAVKWLETLDYDIVYAKPFFFGEDLPERKFITYAFNGSDLLSRNYIDACAVFQKTVWEQVANYDEHMPFAGHEDWEFWVHSFLKGFRFKFIDEELFGYRINKKSMIGNMTDDRFEANQNYILLKHKVAVLDQVRKGIYYQKFYENDQKNYFRTTLKYFVKAVKKLIKLK